MISFHYPPLTFLLGDVITIIVLLVCAVATKERR